jgi:phosphoesterase RecJ-like protein
MKADPMEKAVAALSEARSVAIACHVNPDADALGSMLGLSNHLRGMGKETVCSFGNDPFVAPRWAAELSGTDALVPPTRFPKEPAVMVTCDCASMDRLASLAGAAVHAKTLIWIDHHVTNEGLGSIPIVDPSASSTSELVWRLVRRLGGEVSIDTAKCLYAGLVTDTGRFQYDAVRPETLRLAAELREYPFEHTRLVQALYEDSGMPDLRLLSVALRRLRLEEGADLVWTYLTQGDLRAADVDGGGTDDLIDVVRTAREADVAAVIKQQRDGRFKVSLRSRGDHDVAAVAAHFGGGGHRLASGFTSSKGLAETVDGLKAALGSGP